MYRAAEKTQIIPCHTVAAAIEVKTALNKAELADAYTKIASCKQLKKPEQTTLDQSSNKSGFDSLATMGIVFGFSADTSLATLAENVLELNTQYQSHLWPDLTVVLDQGVIGYSLQWLGQRELGNFMGPFLPPIAPPAASPAYFVNVMAVRDQEFTLNRFFWLLSQHLDLFPYRRGGAPFGSLMRGMSQAMSVGGYQTNRSGQLIRATEQVQQENFPKPLWMKVRHRKTREVITVVEFVKWQDGAMIRKLGPNLDLRKLLPLFTGKVKGQVFEDTMNLRQVQMSAILDITEVEFRKWTKIVEEKTPFKAEIVEPSDPGYGYLT